MFSDIVKYMPPTDPVMQKINREIKKEGYNRTDQGNAEIIRDLFGRRLRYDHRRKRWLLWRGNRWEPDNIQKIHNLAVRSARWRYEQALSIEDTSLRKAESNFAIRSENRSMVESALAMLKTMDGIADDGSGWDLNNMVLSVENGIVDLETGELRRGKPEEKITMVANVEYDSSATAPRWDLFIKEIFDGDEDVIHFVHKALGYSITGLTTAQSAFFCYGTGANGKSVLFKIIMDILGDYAHDAPATLFQRNEYVTNTNDVAETELKRFLVASETLSTAKLNEQRLKAWTGGDRVRARYLYQENFSFEPTVKPWLFINHRPIIQDDSYGFWRRVKLIPFNRTFKLDEQDPYLLDKLKLEKSGILNWLIAGCLLWQEEGLNPVPEKISFATSEYRAENDELQAFIDDMCLLHGEVKSSDLYRAYITWATKEQYKEKEIMSRQMFGRRISDKFTPIRKESFRGYQGICLKSL